MTKDEGSELISLHRNVINQELKVQLAQSSLNEAAQKFSNYIWKLQNQKEGNPNI